MPATAKRFLVLGSIAALLAIVFGAFGAHVLRTRIAPELMPVYRTGVEFQFYHALGLILVGLFFGWNAEAVRENFTHLWRVSGQVPLATGLDAAFHLTRAAWPAMKEHRYGRVVFTVSGRAMRLKDSVASMSAYNASKMGAFGLMLSVAAEGAEHGIRANAISPVADTRMSDRHAQAGALAPELVAPGVLYLASDRCDVSGVVLHAEGGAFRTVAWQAGDEIDCATPEEIAAALPLTSDPEDAPIFAAARAARPDIILSSDFRAFHSPLAKTFWQQNNITVESLYGLLCRFGRRVRKPNTR